MTNTGPIKVIQHDREVLAAAVTAITGLPTEVGDTRLEFLATLTPATSGGVEFILWGDGHVEDMWTGCPACGTDARGPHLSSETVRDRYARLHRLTQSPRRPLLVRLARRVVGCGTCSNEALVSEEGRS
ncbi:hypothetical protein [Nocardioides pakistanensis]